MKIELRPLHLDDSMALAKLLNNKNIWNNLRDYIPQPYTRKDAIQFITSQLNVSDSHVFAISNEKASLVGIISLEPQSDIYRKSAELGYWVGEPFWNKGIASLAVKLITAYGFNTLGLNRIYAGVMAGNTSSMNVLQKNGYHFEGVAKKAILKNEIVLDEHHYAKWNEQ